ncbi:hypothetical protein HRbin36_01973 [bacterium HR36]|nr:hypothetical protein HRbin36_01973 [bacterium HR36]
MPALQEAAEKSNDLEVKRRAADLVRVIEARLAAEKLHRVAEELHPPTRISLVYQNAVVADVLKDLSARTGVPFQLQVPAERKGGVLQKLVTVRLERQPLWQAIDHVLAVCGLRQAEPASLPENMDELPQVFSIEEGALPAGRVCYNGVARVRRLTGLGVKKPAAHALADEPIPLEICLEPRRFVECQVPKSVEIRLLDNQRRPFKTTSYLQPDKFPEPPRPGVLLNPNHPPIVPRDPGWRVLMTLRVEKAALDKAACLDGRIELRVHAQEELVIDNLAQAPRQLYGECNRLQVELIKVSTTDRRTTVVLAERTQALPSHIAQVLAKPEWLRNNVPWLAAGQVRLFDAQGDPCPFVGSQDMGRQEGNTTVYQKSATFTMPGTAKPARLVITGHRRLALLLVAFRFSLTSS